VGYFYDGRCGKYAALLDLPSRLQHSRPMSLGFDDIAARAGKGPPA
jgi:hypothetical protein